MAVIQCMDKNGPTFDVHPDQLCPGFSEQGSYLFSIADLGTRFFVDDVALVPVAHDGGNAWLWKPGFYAGEVCAELVDINGKSIAIYRLGVTPQIHKLSQVSFEQMIEGIFTFDPRLLMGTECAQTQIGVEGGITNPHLQYARLRRYGATVIKALRGITEKPLTALRRERTLQGPNRVKRLDRSSMLKAMRNPAALSVLQGQANDFNANGSILFDVSTVFNDLDTPANQTLAVVLKELIRRTGQVTDALTALEAQEEKPDARSALKPRLARRIQYLQSLGHDLRRIARCEPFASLTSARVSAAGLNVISAHPIYGRAYRFGWYALRPGISGELSQEQLWISPTWEIYERWCYLKVVEVMRSRYPELIWKCVYPTRRTDCIRYTGRGENFKLSIWLQVKCSAFDQKPYKGFSSISGQRFPDIAMTLEASDLKRFLIIDAKYRTSRSGVLEGMHSAHLYRDSLRWFGRRPDCALLLVPKKGGAEKLETIEYRQEHGVGVLALGEDDDLAEVGEVLAELLGAR